MEANHVAGETGFLKRALELRGTQYPYQVYVPVEYTPDRAWSVILFLHGSDEAGHDGEAQTQVGLGPALREYPERFPSIVVFPQALPDSGWRGDMAEMALGTLDKTLNEFHIDPDRVYLTGISMGAYGTWYLAFMDPNRFAALVPVCGGLDVPDLPGSKSSARVSAQTYEAAAERLKHLPVWIFHGAEDDIVPASESRSMVEALRLAGSDVRYTEYPDIAHNAWDPTYHDPQFVTWLLSQSRKMQEELEPELSVQDEWI